MRVALTCIVPDGSLPLSGDPLVPFVQHLDDETPDVNDVVHPTITEGTDVYFDLTFKKANGDPFDLTNKIVTLTVRRTATAVDPLLANLADDSTSDTTTVKVAHAQTEGQHPRTFVYDITMQDGDDDDTDVVLPESHFEMVAKIADEGDEVISPGPGMKLVGIPFPGPGDVGKAIIVTDDDPATLGFTETALANELPDLAGVDGAVLMERPIGTLVFGRLTEDDIDPGFSISTFVGSGTYAATKEIGDTIVNPTFSQTFSSTPATVTLNDGNGAVSLNSPFATEQYSVSPLSPTTYSKTTPNQTVTWTLTATSSGGVVDTAAVVTTWRARVFYGIATPGTLNAAFIQALPSSGLQAARTGSYAVGAGNNTKKAYLGWPTSFGTPTVTSGGFSFPVTKVVSALPVTNGFSAIVNYDLWESDAFQNSAQTLVVS